MGIQKKAYSTKSHNTRLSQGTKKAMGYKDVIGRIVSFAENEIAQLHPDLSRDDRIIKAHEEPYWTAAKECRELSRQEKTQIGLS